MAVVLRHSAVWSCRERQLATASYIGCYVAMGALLGCFGPALVRIASQIGPCSDSPAPRLCPLPLTLPAPQLCLLFAGYDQDSVGALGWIGASRGVGWVTGSALSATALDAMSARGLRCHVVLSVSCALGAASLAATTLAGDLVALLVLCFLNGLCLGSLDTTINTLAAWCE